MNPNEMKNYFCLLFSNLQALCPRDTGNMYRHITVGEDEDNYYIFINAPTARNYDYARAVNEGLRAKFYGTKMTSKERKNYKWIEKAIARTTKVFNGDNYNEGVSNDNQRMD